jgi:hypothetical protein
MSNQEGPSTESANQHHLATESYVRDVLTFMGRETIAQALRVVSQRVNAIVKSTPLERMPRRQLTDLSITIVSGMQKRTVGTAWV